MKSKITIFVIVFALISNCIAAYALTSDQKQSNFEAAIIDLETYLESSENDISDLVLIQDHFDELERYKNSNFFKYYVTVLLKIEKNEFDSVMEIYLEILDTPSFNSYLNSYIESIESSSIRPIEELKAYKQARESQYEGDNALACEYYLKCITFYDSEERYRELQNAETLSTYDQAIALLESENYAEAYELFSTIRKYKDSEIFMEYIENKLGGVPYQTSPEPTVLPTEKPDTALSLLKDISLTLRTNCYIGYNSLTWNTIEEAVSYTILRHQTNGSYIDIATVTDTQYRDNSISGSYRYYYTVIANLPNGETVTSNEEVLVAATAKPEQTHNHSWVSADCTHPKTCSTCGATEGSALGHNWKAADCTHAKTCQRCGATTGSALGHNWQPATEKAPKTCSRCGATEGSKLTWSAWSSWSTTPVSSSATREVQTEVREESTYKTVYKYTRYQYIGKNGNHWYAAYDYSSNSNYVRGGNWQTKISDTPLAKDSMVPHANGKSYQVYKGHWYNEEVTTQVDSTKSVTYYRYRDLK